jgi:hypothetical protein
VIVRIACSIALAWLALAPLPQSGGSGRGLTSVPMPVGPNGSAQVLYTGSYALLVGVSRYDTASAWAPLDSIPGELNQLADTLRAAGFDRVQQISNPTGQELRRAIEDFIGTYGYVPGNRLVFFFSGHGHTLDDGSRGYFVPRDAPDPLVNEAGFRRTAVSMDQFATWARDLVARHALFSFDSCFSGTIFRTRDRAVPARLSELTAKPVRQFVSAAGAGEPVPARSVFTPVFIRGLKGEADLDQDGFVTGTELGNYVQREVIAYKSGQTPQFGKIRDPELDEGDVVFAVVRPAAARPEPPPAPGVSTVTFTTEAGMLLIQIKPDRTAVFEDLIQRLTTGLRSAPDDGLRRQAEGFRFYRAAEKFAENAGYVMLIDAATPSAEYHFFALLARTMSQAELYAPETQGRFTEWAAAFASMSQLSLTRTAGGGRSPARSEVAASPPETRRLVFTADAGLLLAHIKPDQTAVFEDFVATLEARLQATTDPVLRRQAIGFTVYRASESVPPNVLYVIALDPAVKEAEYDLTMLLHRLMTPEEQRAPETAAMFDRVLAAVASLQMMNLTPLEAH